MCKAIYLTLYFFHYLYVSLNGQVLNRQEIEKGTSIQRNATYNLEEIKVRWKKAALENCTGVPCIVAPSFTCGTTISDIDGNTYNTVLIGTQCWTKENLKVTKYNDGSNITEITSTGTWGLTTVTGARTVYNDLPANLSTYGYLYNWYAAAGIVTPMGSPTKNICPTGWHVPTDSNWNKLVKFIDSGADTSNASSTLSPTAGTLMKKDTALWTTNTGTNTSGFSALPGGYRGAFGGFFWDINILAVFWSATEVDGQNGEGRNLDSANGNVIRYMNPKSVGYSVRCLRD